MFVINPLALGPILMQEGKEFDALLIDVKAPTSRHPVFDVFQKDTFDVCALKTTCSENGV